MTLAELHAWTLFRKWGPARRAELQRHLAGYPVWFADEELCQSWAEVRAQTFRVGRPMDVADAWIAATALAMGAPVVTNNPDDFSMVPGLNVLTAR